jgi:hypothetical protein
MPPDHVGLLGDNLAFDALVDRIGPQHVLDSTGHGLAVMPDAVIEHDHAAARWQDRGPSFATLRVRIEPRAASDA